MKKAILWLGLSGMIFVLSGCVSAREAQNPQPRKAVVCESWEKLEASQK